MNTWGVEGEMEVGGLLPVSTEELTGPPPSPALEWMSVMFVFGKIKSIMPEDMSFAPFFCIPCA